jgi:hypothetical protein
MRIASSKKISIHFEQASRIYGQNPIIARNTPRKVLSSGVFFRRMLDISPPVLNHQLGDLNGIDIIFLV